MTDIHDIHSLRPTPPVSPPELRSKESESQAQPATRSIQEEVDSADFSEAAIALARAASKSSLMIARLASIRAEIESGTYETPERVNRAVDGLMKDLFSEA